MEKSKSIEAGLQTLSLSAEVVEEDPKSIPKYSLMEKIKLIFSNITVEPIMVLYVLPSVMSSLAIQNLSLEKACRVNLELNRTTCDAITVRNSTGYLESEEVAVQKLVASMNAWKNIVQSLLPSILLLFIGSWSDRHNRRKPCIILPIIGEIMASTGFIICTYFFYELPMEWNGISESLPPSITGGWFTMFVGVFSYISVLSSVETRTLRIGAVSLFSNVSVTIGIALSGILYREIGFYGVFSLALSMYTVALLYGCLTMKEAKNETAKKIHEDEEVKRKNFLMDFFDFEHVVETFRVAFKRGKRNRKARICTVMVLVMVVIGPLHGK